jgi:putative nucleotidyltransferase with HDIG domain
MMNDPGSSFQDMSKVIETDVGLASKVLKLANSAHYSIPGGVQSLEKAVIYLGMTTIYQMVLCMQSQQVLGNAGKVPEFLAGHSLAVAMLAKTVSEKLGLPIPDRAFSAGLLHDFGRLAIFVLFPKKSRNYIEAIKKGALHSIEMEREIIGMDHQQVGAELARHWKYPRGLAWVIADHHGPGQEVRDRSEKDFQMVSDIVAVADSWSWCMGWPGIEGQNEPQLYHEREKRIGLPSEPQADQRDQLQEMINLMPKFLKN